MSDLVNQYDYRFDSFYKLYEDYNSHTNISAIRDKAEVYEKHFHDSLSAIPFILKQYPKASLPMQVLDIGTGGGFPAVPLAIVLEEDFSDIEITAIDSVGKKTKFVEQVAEQMSLNNLKVIQSRAEDLDLNAKFDVALSRALAYLPEALEYTAPLLKPGGIYIAYKKQDIEHEIKDAEEVSERLNLKLEQVHPYEDKQLLIYRKVL